MDYTKDAILIHEGMKSSFEDDSVTLDNEDNEHGGSDGGGGNMGHQTSFETFSILAMMNGSDSMERKTLMDAGRMNSSAHLPTSGILEGDPYNEFNDTMEYVPYSMRPETYIVPVLFAIIFIIGVIGNGTLIVIFIKHRSMRNVPNMFIVSLAIGDLLLILFCVPFTSTVYTVDSWPYGLIVCKFSEFIKDLSVGVSVFTLTALSADRYFAIVDPMRKLTGRRATRITIISIIGIWTLSILVALPSALYSYIRVFPEYEEGEEPDPEDDGRTFQVCYPYPTEFGPIYAQAMVMFHFLVYYAIPLFFIATFYIIMARHLVLSTRNMPGEAQGQVKQIQARKKVAKMILSFVVIFAICFFPHHLFLLWFYFYPDSENLFNPFWNICRIVGFCLSFMNSCINPITLYCVSGTFRKQFNDHLFCCICNNSGGRPSRGERISQGGTLAARGGGGNGGGLCAACVSLSGNNGQLQGNDGRYENGRLGRGGNGRLQRGSTWEYSDRMMSKRKSTWETQTTVCVNQNHRVLNMVGGSGANIHVNLCSEHEHIPLRTMVGQHHRKLTTGMVDAEVAVGGGEQGEAVTNNTLDLQENGEPLSVNLHQNYLSNHDTHYQATCHPSSATPMKCDLQGHSHGRRESGSGGCNDSNNIIFSTSKARFNLNKLSRDACEHHLEKEQEDDDGDETEEEEIVRHRYPKSTNNTNYPSLIEEETSEHESSSKSNQLSPNKSYSEKVGEIFSRISSKYNHGCNSPGKLFSKNPNNIVASESSSCSAKKSPTKVAPSNSPILSSGPGLDENEDAVGQINFNNNNNYNHHNESSGNRTEKQTRQDESDGDEYTNMTVTSFVDVPETMPLKSKLGAGAGNVIICYN